jgi:hypothetical protein
LLEFPKGEVSRTHISHWRRAPEPHSGSNLGQHFDSQVDSHAGRNKQTPADTTVSQPAIFRLRRLSADVHKPTTNRLLISASHPRSRGAHVSHPEAARTTAGVVAGSLGLPSLRSLSVGCPRLFCGSGTMPSSTLCFDRPPPAWTQRYRNIGPSLRTFGDPPNASALTGSRRQGPYA